MPTNTSEQHLVKNFWQGRGNAKPLAIVEHVMQGTLEETAAIFDGKPTNDGHAYKVSAHYGVARDGRVWQFVRDEDTAWANGVLSNPDPALDWLQPNQPKFNANVVTLSVEYEGFTGEAFTEAQYEAALVLHHQLVERWQIPADANHIVGHDRLDAAERNEDPGPAFPWARLLTDLHNLTTQHPTSVELTETAPTDSEKQVEMEQLDAMQPEAAQLSPEHATQPAEQLAEPQQAEHSNAVAEPALDQPDFNPRDLATKPLTAMPQPIPQPIEVEQLYSEQPVEYAIEQQSETFQPELAADQNYAVAPPEQTNDESSQANSSLPPMLEEDLSQYYRLDDILAQSGQADAVQHEQEDTQVFALDDILAQAQHNQSNPPTQSFALPNTSQDEVATPTSDASSEDEAESGRFELPDWLKDEGESPFATSSQTAASPVQSQPAATTTPEPAISNLGVPSGSQVALPEDDALLPLDLSDLLEQQPPAIATTTATTTQPMPETSQTGTAAPSQTQEVSTQLQTEATPTHKEAETPKLEEFAGVDNAIRQNIGTGVISVELANIRTRPSFEEGTILRTADETEKFHFDAYAEGPELNNSTHWLHIAAEDGDGWIHASLVTLDDQNIHLV